jgi:hypothetical protein
MLSHFFGGSHVNSKLVNADLIFRRGTHTTSNDPLQGVFTSQKVREHSDRRLGATHRDGRVRILSKLIVLRAKCVGVVAIIERMNSRKAEVEDDCRQISCAYVA